MPRPDQVAWADLQRALGAKFDLDWWLGTVLEIGHHPQAVRWKYVLLLALARWLEVEDVLDASARRVIVTEYDCWLDRMGAPAWTGFLTRYLGDGEPLPEAGELPAWTLTIADRRYVGWTGCQVWLDLRTEITINELPRPAVTFLVCDLTALFLRLVEKLEARYGHSHPPADVGPAAGEAG